MIKGFEDDVGTKTSFYGFTVNTMKNSLISYRELGFTSVPQGQVRPLLGATVPRAPPRGRHRVPRPQPSGTEQPWTGAGVAGVHCRLTGCQAIHVGPVSLVRRLRLGALRPAKQQEGWGSSLGSPPELRTPPKGAERLLPSQHWPGPQSSPFPDGNVPGAATQLESPQASRGCFHGPTRPPRKWCVPPEPLAARVGSGGSESERQALAQPGRRRPECAHLPPAAPPATAGCWATLLLCVLQVPQTGRGRPQAFCDTAGVGF